ncbi:MAG: PCRF domain-containing protein, partial [Myxococcota bacterium]
MRRRLDALETETARPDLWEEREAAEKLLREKRLVEREVGFFDSLESNLEDAEVLLDLAAEADDGQTRSEAAEKLEAAARDLEEAEFRRMLGGENDASNAIVSINSGAGGTDACDWAEMLMRMYLRWAERHGFQTEMIDQQAGEEAGLRGATFAVKGEFAFGYLKAEDGVHRLVRISPFDSQARRHTAFASETVAPENDYALEV